MLQRSVIVWAVFWPGHSVRRFTAVLVLVCTEVCRVVCALFLYARHMKAADPVPCSAASVFQGTGSAAAVFPFCTSKYLQSFYDLNLYFSELR